MLRVYETNMHIPKSCLFDTHPNALFYNIDVDEMEHHAGGRLQDLQLDLQPPYDGMVAV